MPRMLTIFTFAALFYQYTAQFSVIKDCDDGIESTIDICSPFGRCFNAKVNSSCQANNSWLMVACRGDVIRAGEINSPGMYPFTMIDYFENNGKQMLLLWMLRIILHLH